MALQLSVAVRNARLDKFNDGSFGAGGTLNIYTGAAPATCDAAATGTVLATITLPNPFFAAASGGVMAKTGTWADLSADATGTAGYFRIWSPGAVPMIQGTVGTSATDMIVDSTAFTAGQSFSVISFTLTAANA
jgi:hypothetical protein